MAVLEGPHDAERSQKTKISAKEGGVRDQRQRGGCGPVTLGARAVAASTISSQREFLDGI